MVQDPNFKPQGTCRLSGRTTLAFSGLLGSLSRVCSASEIWEFPIIRVPYVGVLIIKDPTIWGTILGSPIFGNPHCGIWVWIKDMNPLQPPGDRNQSMRKLPGLKTTLSPDAPALLLQIEHLLLQYLCFYQHPSQRTVAKQASAHANFSYEANNKRASTAARSGERLQRELQLAAQGEAILGRELGVHALWHSNLRGLAPMPRRKILLHPEVAWIVGQRGADHASYDLGGSLASQFVSPC